MLDFETTPLGVSGVGKTYFMNHFSGTPGGVPAPNKVHLITIGWDSFAIPVDTPMGPLVHTLSLMTPVNGYTPVNKARVYYPKPNALAITIKLNVNYTPEVPEEVRPKEDTE